MSESKRDCMYAGSFESRLERLVRDTISSGRGIQGTDRLSIPLDYVREWAAATGVQYSSFLRQAHRSPLVLRTGVVVVYQGRAVRSLQLPVREHCVESPVKEKAWDEFRAFGMLWLVNRMLHVFGWSIVVDVDDAGSVTRAYPARVKFRGFSDTNETEGFRRVSKYMVEAAEELKREADA